MILGNWEQKMYLGYEGQGRGLWQGAFKLWSEGGGDD